MRITILSGTFDLDEDARPSLDDKNNIVDSVTSNDTEFLALCEASTAFPANLTNGEFLAACEEWLSRNA